MMNWSALRFSSKNALKLRITHELHGHREHGSIKHEHVSTARADDRNSTPPFA